MKLILASVAVAAIRLALASLVVAQVVDVERTEPVPPRLEAGAVVGTTGAFPELGAVFSVPVHGRASVEVTGTLMPRIYDTPAHTLVQVQLRTPFRPDLRSRKSLVLGLTRIASYDEPHQFLGGDEDEPFVRPHAGVSLQWPAGPVFDLRVDVHGILTFDGELPLLPRAMAGFVWHPRTAR